MRLPYLAALCLLLLLPCGVRADDLGPDQAQALDGKRAVAPEMAGTVVQPDLRADPRGAEGAADVQIEIAVAIDVGCRG